MVGEKHLDDVFANGEVAERWSELAPADKQHGALNTEVRKRVFLSHLYIKMLFLPRQARDKHKKSSKKDAFSLAGDEVCSRQGR